MNQLADLLWLRLPAAVRRFWLAGGAALGDGGYLRRWPTAALAVPAGGFALGALLGLVHPGLLYTYSLLVVVLMLAVAALGAGVGVWVWLGYTVVDLVATDRTQLPGFAPYATNTVLHGYVPLLLTYLLLAILLVMGPLLAGAFGVRATVTVRRASRQAAVPTGYAVSVLVLAGFTYAWAQATPFLIRPLWSFAGNVPDIAAVQPIQSHTGLLAGFAVLAGLVRAGLTVAARRGPARPPAVALPPITDRPVAGGWLRLVSIPFQAGLVTLLFGGLVDNLILGVAVFVLLCLVLAARVLLVPLIPGYPALVGKVPVLLRIGASALVTYLLSGLIVTPAINRGERSFSSLLVVIFISLAISALLLPGRPPAGWPRGTRAGPGTRPATGTGPRPAGPATGAAVLVALALGGALLVGWQRPAYADNCSGLTDCSFAIKIGLALIGITIVALAIVLLPELLAGAGLEAAAGEGLEAVGGEALGGMVSGGGTGAGGFTAAEIASAEAAAEAAGIDVGESVTAAQIDAVEAHLSQFGSWGPNEAMINGIREAAAEGRALSVAEQNFMNHELTEMELMNQGMSQELAHQGALSVHDLYANYSPEVIQQFADLFNSNWFKYWGL